MNQRTLNILEFHKITAFLADCATSAPGKARCVALAPAESMGEAVRALKETADAMKLQDKKGQISFFYDF